MGSPSNNHLLLAIGIKKKPDSPQAPRSLRDQLMTAGTAAPDSPRPGHGRPPSDYSSQTPTSTGRPQPSSSPSGMAGLIPGMDDQNGQGGGLGAKASRDDAGFIPAGQICGACANYTKESGDCSKVEGSFQAHDTCKQYFEAANGGASDAGDLQGLEASDRSTPSAPTSTSPSMGSLQNSMSRDRSSIGTMNA